MALDAMMNAALGETSTARSIGESNAFAFVEEPNILARVLVLLLTSGPSAVVRLIVAVIIDAVYGMKRAWPRPHVLQKGREVFSPLLTDTYAAAPISGVGVVEWIKATLLHRAPHPIFCGMAATVRGMVDSGLSRLPHPTSTTTCVAAPQVSALHHGFVAAVAKAAPRRSLSGECPFQNNQMTHSSASQVKESSHMTSIHGQTAFGYTVPA